MRAERYALSRGAIGDPMLLILKLVAIILAVVIALFALFMVLAMVVGSRRPQ